MSSSNHSPVSERTSDKKYYAVVTPQGEFLSTKTYVSEEDAKTFIGQNLQLADDPDNRLEVIPVWVTIRDAR